MTEQVKGLVSTIIPYYNRPQLLQEAVDSVLAQTYRPIEIIISDDGSEPGNAAVADRLAMQHPKQIRVVHNRNRGAGPAREAGRQLARGEFIQYLDSDDLLLPDKFAIQVKALREHPECGAAYGYIRLLEPGKPPGTSPYKLSGKDMKTLFPQVLIDRWWNTDAPLFRRTVCDQVGPWSDLQYSQDWEYDARVGALGTKLVHCPEFVCVQRQHGDVRQTGSGKWLEPEAQVRFFKTLFQCAQLADVKLESPEMKHFSRWVFFQARECGAAGSSDAASSLLALARKAAGNGVGLFSVYSALAGLLGWRSMGRLSRWLITATRKQPGRHTLKQSWMTSNDA